MVIHRIEQAICKAPGEEEHRSANDGYVHRFQGWIAAPLTVLNVEFLDTVYDFFHCAADVITRHTIPYRKGRYGFRALKVDFVGKESASEGGACALTLLRRRLV